MARSMWTGVVSFGLVAVPVKLYSATKDHDVSFHQFEEGTKDRIRYQRVNERTGKEVDYSDIVKGAETDDGYVMVDSDELDSVAPGRSRVLEIHTFVEQTDIDPVHYQKAYYLGPGTDETSRTYALLRDAMAKADRVAIGTLVMRGKEYLAAIRPRDDILVLETMYFADEIRDPDELLDSVPGRAKGKPNELKTAVQLIDSMTGPWQPEEFRDTYTDRVNELIEAKRKGNEVTVADEAPAATNVVDLMSALRASVEAAKKGRGGGAKKTASAKKAAPTKKTAPAKKAASSKKTAPAKKSAPAKKATSAKRAAPAKKAASTKTTTKKAATKKAAPTKRSAAKKTSPAKGTRRKAA